MPTINYIHTFLDKTSQTKRVLAILENENSNPVAQVLWDGENKWIYLFMLQTIEAVSWLGTYRTLNSEDVIKIYPYEGIAVGIKDESIGCGYRVDDAINSQNDISNCALTLDEENVLTFDANIIKINTQHYEIMLKADNIKRFDG